MRRLRLFELILAAGCLGIAGGAAPARRVFRGSSGPSRRSGSRGQSQGHLRSQMPRDGMPSSMRCWASCASVPRHRARTTGSSHSTGYTRCGSRWRSRRGRRVRRSATSYETGYGRGSRWPGPNAGWLTRSEGSRLRPAQRCRRTVSAGSSSSTRTWDGPSASTTRRPRSPSGRRPWTGSIRPWVL